MTKQVTKCRTPLGDCEEEVFTLAVREQEDTVERLGTWPLPVSSVHQHAGS